MRKYCFDSPAESEIRMKLFMNVLVTSCLEITGPRGTYISLEILSSSVGFHKQQKNVTSQHALCMRDLIPSYAYTCMNSFIKHFLSS